MFIAKSGDDVFKDDTAYSVSYHIQKPIAPENETSLESNRTV